VDAIIVLFMLFLTFPLVSLLHEWGHYVVAKQLGMNVTKIQLGTGYPLSKWKQGETEIQFNWNCFFGGYTFIEGIESYSRSKRFLVIIAGLGVSFVTYLISWKLLGWIGTPDPTLLEQWLYVFMIMNIYLGAVQLFPFRRGVKRTHTGYPSDGLLLFHLMMKKESEQKKNK
jgi:hypothetical protein